jgi:hypothetical protein
MRDEPEKVEAQDTDSPEGQEAEADQDSESTDGEGEDSQDGEKELSDKEKRRKDREYKKRLREEAAEAKRELEAAKARQDRVMKAGESSSPPQEKDFEDYSEYVAAKAVWKYSRETHSREAEAVGSEVEEAERKLQQIDETEKRLVQENFAAQVADARTRYSDFDAVVTARDVPISDGVVDIVMQSDQGADVAYHLASNKALAAEISAMSPLEAARAIGRIEAQLSAPKPRTTSTAPDPISPVKGKAAATKDPAKMSYAEFVKAREAGKL